MPYYFYNCLKRQFTSYFPKKNKTTKMETPAHTTPAPTSTPQSPIKWEDTTEFTFPITGGQVIKVYDGDTITIASKLPYPTSPLYRLSVRLNGIDTPEIKGKTEDEKNSAKRVRDALSTLILHQQVQLQNIQSEKYGRILADVYYNGIHINEWMIQQRYATRYDGGKKCPPKSWTAYIETGAIDTDTA